MSRCPACGKDFDRRAFQVVVPGLAGAFDRVDCALEALEEASRPKRPAPRPLAVPRPRRGEGSTSSPG